MSAVDPLDKREIDRYQAGVRHGRVQVLEHEALAAVSLELVMLRAAYATVCAELEKRERTIAAYRAIIRG